MSVTAAGAGASGKGKSCGIDENADSPASVSSGRSSSDAAASPERSTPSAKGDSKQQLYKKKQPLLLHRAKWQQQNRASLSRPAPGGLAAAAAAANARASVAAGGGVVSDRHGSQTGLTGAASGGEGEATAATADVATPDATVAVDVDRAAAAGARAMRGALEGLRSERDSLANACGRLEADREAASVQLREGGELVKRLTEARETLEADKRALAERCAALQGEVDAYTSRKEEEEEETAREDAESGLRARVVELEKNLERNEELVGCCCRCTHAETSTDHPFFFVSRQRIHPSLSTEESPLRFFSLFGDEVVRGLPPLLFYCCF